MKGWQTQASTPLPKDSTVCKSWYGQVSLKCDIRTQTSSANYDKKLGSFEEEGGGVNGNG